MRITVFGAAGDVGSRVVAEAVARGHKVTAVGRNPARLADSPVGVIVRQGDARNVEDVASLSAGQDLVISATRPVPGSEHELAIAAKGLLAGAAASGVRLLVVGGASSLFIPDSPGTTVVDAPGFPDDLRPIALACSEQLDVFRADAAVDWTYLSPPALLEPGERTGRFRLGRDELIVDTAGNSSISMEDLAIALLDEAERPQHPRTRFTIGY
ncbi:NAD(P)H-binding protein [Kribbella sp. NBC_01245]|uniref:NAD(P)-dependent oxidoreductase n=1 Tax=Kribbella sp. NBC_01245 TaxID=2903578 RepID=UPI002E2BC963|nr:NAD(P)H-binding protein [Kribbella sp. NBC_01245]